MAIKNKVIIDYLLNKLAEFRKGELNHPVIQEIDYAVYFNFKGARIPVIQMVIRKYSLFTKIKGALPEDIIANFGLQLQIAISNEDWDTDEISWQMSWGNSFHGYPEDFHPLLENAIPLTNDDEFNYFLKLELTDYAS